MRHLVTFETGQVVILDRQAQTWSIVRGDSEGGLSHGTYVEAGPLTVGAPLVLRLPVHTLTFSRVRALRDIREGETGCVLVGALGWFLIALVAGVGIYSMLHQAVPFGVFAIVAAGSVLGVALAISPVRPKMTDSLRRTQ